MADQQEMFEYSPAPNQTNDTIHPTNQEVSDPIQIELDADEQYQIGDKVMSGEEIIAGRSQGSVNADDPIWNDVVGLREEVARLQGQLSSVEQSRNEAEEPVEEAPPQVNRLSEVMQAAVEQDRHIDQEYLVDLFQAFWSDVKDDVRRELVSQASVDNTEAILEKKLTSLGEQQIAQQSKHESALKVFNDFVGNKASRLGVSEDSIREDYQALADQVLTDPSMLTMQTGEEAGNLMLQRLNTLDKIIEKRTGSSPAPRSNQQNQAQLNSGNGKVYTPKRSNAIKMPVYPSEEESRYAFIQRVKQADRVIG